MENGNVLELVKAMLANPQGARTDAEKAAVAEVLKCLSPGGYGTPLFDALNHLTWTIAFEAACFRMQGGVEQIYLRQRSLTDTAYPGEWHCPGTSFRALDGRAPRDEDMNPVEVVGKRLAKGEFGIDNFTRVIEIQNFWNPNEKRGSYLSVVIRVEVPDTIEEGKAGRWFPVTAMPEPLVHHHKVTIIPIALAHWRAERAKWFGLHLWLRRMWSRLKTRTK